MKAAENERVEIPDKVLTLSEENYQMVPNILVNEVREKRIISLDVVVWMVFANHQRKKNNSWLSNKTVAKYIGMDVRSAIRSINRLKDAGHLTRNGKTQHGTRFTSLLTLVKDGGVKRHREKISIFPDQVSPRFDFVLTEKANADVQTREAEPSLELPFKRSGVFSEYFETNQVEENKDENRPDSAVSKTVEEFDPGETGDGDVPKEVIEEYADSVAANQGDEKEEPDPNYIPF